MAEAFAEGEDGVVGWRRGVAEAFGQVLEAVGEVIYDEEVRQVAEGVEPRVGRGDDAFVAREVVEEFRGKLRLGIRRGGVVEEEAGVGGIHFFLESVLVKETVKAGARAAGEDLFEGLGFDGAGAAGDVEGHGFGEMLDPLAELAEALVAPEVAGEEKAAVLGRRSVGLEGEHAEVGQARLDEARRRLGGDFADAGGKCGRDDDGAIDGGVNGTLEGAARGSLPVAVEVEAVLIFENGFEVAFAGGAEEGGGVFAVEVVADDEDIGAAGVGADEVFKVTGGAFLAGGRPAGDGEGRGVADGDAREERFGPGGVAALGVGRAVDFDGVAKDGEVVGEEEDFFAAGGAVITGIAAPRLAGGRDAVGEEEDVHAGAGGDFRAGYDLGIADKLACLTKQANDFLQGLRLGSRLFESSSHENFCRH